MLRITPQYRAESVQRYFVEALCKDDYYTQGTEEPGLWRGRAAELLGLDGPVDRESFSRLTQNRHPFKEERLTPRDRDGRRVGYDITFSPPKSVSVLYAVTRDEDVLWAFRKSVWDTMREMEASMATRVRRDGANYDRPTGNMVWSEYLHFTTRPVDGEPDPHLHIHNFSHNCTFDEDEQRFKAAQFGVLKSRAPYFEALALSKLAANLFSVGYQVERTEHAFEVVGVPTQALSEFSRRTQLIESIASELGFEQERKAALGAKTRERKTDEFTLDELHERWSARLSPEDITAIRNAKGRPAERVPEAERQQAQTIEAIKDNIRQPEPEPGPASDGTSTRQSAPRWHPLVSLSANGAVKRAMAELFATDAIVLEDRLLTRSLELSIGKADAQQLRDAIAKQPDLVRRKLGDVVYVTTKEAVQEERWLVQFAKQGRNAMKPLGRDPLSWSKSRLDDWDRSVLRKLMESTDRITLFKHTGPTRKPELSRAAMTGIQQRGYKLVVVAPNATSARQAEADYGIKDVQTVHGILGNSEYQSLLKNIVPKAMPVVFWVEDAGRLGTRTVSQLGRIAERAGARLVLSGDEERSKKYERGNPFRLLREQARLKTAERGVMVDRQNALDKAVTSIRQDNAAWSIGTLKELNKLQVTGKREDTLAAATQFYLDESKAGRSVLLATPSFLNQEQLTNRVREALRAAGQLTGREQSVLRLMPLQWSHEEKRKASNYERGMVIDFVRPTRGFKSGDRTKVVGTDPLGGVYVRGKMLTPVRLNLSHADRFMVSRARRGHLAVGDRIRLRKSLKPLIGKPLKAGTVVTVTGFNPFGQIAVSGARLLPRGFGHFEHDYAVSTHRLHGRRADSVGFVAYEHGWVGADNKDLAAAGEAAKKEFKVFADDEEALLNTLGHQRPSLNATDLEQDPDLVEVEILDYEHRFGRLQPDDIGGMRYGN